MSWFGLKVKGTMLDSAGYLTETQFSEYLSDLADVWEKSSEIKEFVRVFEKHKIPLSETFNKVVDYKRNLKEKHGVVLAFDINNVTIAQKKRPDSSKLSALEQHLSLLESHAYDFRIFEKGHNVNHPRSGEGSLYLYVRKYGNPCIAVADLGKTEYRGRLMHAWNCLDDPILIQTIDVIAKELFGMEHGMYL